MNNHNHTATKITAEQHRLNEAHRGEKPWRQWGSYLSERQWGTVREDYSAGGTAWDYLPHDHARSQAYRWGEDGLAGWCDDHCGLCLSVALWNEKDPILKERLFGLTNSEGNHGEDVKECYWYVDGLPTHSYMKMLYKYPQREFPYGWLADENRRRSKQQPEFELVDTGVFDDDRYFDVFVEYAKNDPHDTLMQITVINRGPEGARLHVLPQLWFRNIWSWRPEFNKPRLEMIEPGTVGADHYQLGRYHWYIDGKSELLFTENDTNVRRLFGMAEKGYFKDAFHECVIQGNHGAVNPEKHGTKTAAHFVLEVPARGTVTLRTRLCGKPLSPAFLDFDSILELRRKEADEFYAHLQRNLQDEDAKNVQRQALAGLIWTEQFFHYDVARWLHGDELQPTPPESRKFGRNIHWRHLKCREIMSVPDNWEFPWFAAWDLAFHCVSLALVDAEFAKEQLVLLGREWFMHPNGQLPAYEWAFGDVNPPVHAWAAWRVYQIDRNRHGHHGDRKFLERVFHKLLLNFTWWVNRKDAENRNVFDGGFLGLDNIAAFDRNAPLPTGARIAQADSTGWMAMYCLNLMRMALELALHDSAYESIATKFFEHFLAIVEAMNHMGSKAADDDGGIGMWDDEEEWYCSVAQMAGGKPFRMSSFSMVSLIPLFAVETLEPHEMTKLGEFMGRLTWLRDHRKDLANLVAEWKLPGMGERRLLAMMRGHRMKRVLARMLDETQFLSDYGVRSLSKWHEQHPLTGTFQGHDFRLNYEPGESQGELFGGNSNWRGPIWFPVNYLIVESLQKFHHYYGDDFKIECPTGSGKYLTLLEVADELTRRLTKIFLRGADGRRPVYGQYEKLQSDPHFRDYIWFHEYFHGDNGRGLGASHQTGWTALAAKLLQPRKPPREGPSAHAQNGNNGAAAHMDGDPSAAKPAACV